MNTFTKLIFIYDFHYFDLTFVEVEQDQSTYVSVTVHHVFLLGARCSSDIF